MCTVVPEPQPETVKPEQVVAMETKAIAEPIPVTMETVEQPAG